MMRYCYLMVLLPIMCESFRKLDKWKLEEGKRQFDVIERNKNMPKYGQCWTNTLESLQADCRTVSDELQTSLALAYLNCFLMTQGRQPYLCEDGDSLQSCTKDLADADRSSLATFFTHTHNICYFLQSQVWHENTENTINRLSTRSDEVAIQLEQSSQLQLNIIQQQNLSLLNQKHLLDQTTNLSSVINESTSNIHGLFNEFQRTTSEQRVLINEIFDRVSRIQSTIIGEVIGFYSVLLYTLAITICYLLTSTARTSCARFPLFGIVTLNFVVEKEIFSLIVDSADSLTRTEEADQNERVYQYQWVCRQVSGVCGLIALLWCAYRYRDYNAINNQLLLDIHTQNIELKQALQERKKRSKENSFTNDQHIATISNNINLENRRFDSESNTDGDSDDYGYHSNTHISLETKVKDKASPQDIKESHLDVDTWSESSFTTALSGNMSERSRPLTRSSTRSPTLQTELGNIQDVSSYTKIREQISNWAANGYYDADTEESYQENTEDSLNAKEHLAQISPLDEETPVIRRYNLRQRKHGVSGKSKTKANL